MSSAQVVLIVLLAVADLALWVAGAIAPLSTTGRFRTLAAATVLLAVVCGNVIGWHRTAALGAVALWLAAMVAGTFRVPSSVGANRSA